MNILGIVHPYTHDAAACIMMQRGIVCICRRRAFYPDKISDGDTSIKCD